MIDLGDWAAERRAIPGSEANEDFTDPSIDQDPDGGHS